MAKKKKADDTFRLVINGAELTGEKHNGEWAWKCPQWPDLAKKWEGDTVLTNIVEEFVPKALVGAITVRRLAST